MEHSRLLKFLVPGRDKENTTTTMSEESPTFKIQYEYQNPTDVEAEVPGSQSMREVDPTTLDTSNEGITDGAVSNEVATNEDFTLQPVITVTKKEATLTKGDLKLQKVTVTEDIAVKYQHLFKKETKPGKTVVTSISEFRNGGYTVTKRTYTEHREIIQGTEVTQTTLTLTTGGGDVKEIESDHIVEKRARTKIPKLKFRQAAERVREERRKSKENKEYTSHIPTPRNSIPKLSRVSKVPPPTTKPIVTKREIKQTIITSEADDDFDKIYEAAVESTDGAGDLTDPEKVDSEFEEIIHAYDESKVEVPIPRVRQSKIPSLRRKSDHEVEAQKSSTRFNEKSKVRSIPRLKEISMRAKADNNDVGEVVRQFTKTVRTEKDSGSIDLEGNKDSDNTGSKSFIKTSKLMKIIRTGDVSLNDQNSGSVSEQTENASLIKSSKLTKIIKSDKSYGNDKSLFEKQKFFGDDKFHDDTNNKTNNIIPISTKIIKTQKSSDNDNLDAKEEEENTDFTKNRNISKITRIVTTAKMDQDLGFSDIIKETQINTVNSSISMESKNDTAFLKTENIEKTSVKVGIPVFNKQISKSYIGKRTQTLHSNINVERSSSEAANITSDSDKILYDIVTQNKVTQTKTDILPTRKETYTITRISSNINNKNLSEPKETEYAKDSTNINQASVIHRKLYEVKSEAPTEITKTVSITRLISSPNEVSNQIEHRREIEDVNALEISQLSPLKLETVPSKESSSLYTKHFEKDNATAITIKRENEGTDDELLKLKGKVGRLINKIDTKASTITDITRKDLDEKLPKKKSILSKISNKIEQRKELEDMKTIQIEKDIEISQPSILNFETVHSKESSIAFTTDSEKVKDVTITNKETENEGSENRVLELQGKVGSLINRIDTKTSTLTDISKKDLDEELPKKKSILSKIAMFERQDINEPMPRRKPRPEKLSIKEIDEEKSVHIHTPKIVDEVLKSVQTSEITDQDENISSPEDPFLTYKPLYEHYKSMEIINKSIESLDNKVETSKYLEVKTSNLQAPISPLRTTFSSNSLNNMFESTSNIMVDAPVILISPNTNFKKNINLNTEENTAEFAKTVVSVKETKNVEVLKPIETNVDYEVSKIEVESSKLSKTSNDAEITAFKDVKKNIAMYENYGNLSKTVYKAKSTNFNDYTMDTKFDKDKANFEMKIKNEFKYDNTLPTNETSISKEDVKFGDIKPINTALTDQMITYENVIPMNEKEFEEFTKPISAMISKENLEHEKNQRTNTVFTRKEEIKYEKIRPVSEILMSKAEFEYQNVRPISQILTVKDENEYQKVAVNADFAPGDSSYKNKTKHKYWLVNKRISSHDTEVDQTEEDTGVSTNETYRIDGKYKITQTKQDSDNINMVKSVAELDLGDAVKGKANSVVLRMRSVDAFGSDKKDAINIKEMPRTISVWEKIALFEGKVTAARSDSLFISSRTKSVRSRLTVQLTEEDYRQKLEELQSVKKKHGKREEMPSVTLSNGANMPVLAVGTALLDTRLTSHVVTTAIDLGYRAIDCAFINGNEKQIGDAIREKIADGTVRREDLFITSKLWSTFHRRDLVEKACRASLDAMGLSYFDLYLIQNPMSFKEGDDPIPKIATVLQYSQYDYLDAWYGMEELVRKGLVNSIGLSNFNSVQIQRILDKGKIKPVINQVECHPYLSQQRHHSFCAERNIVLSCFGVLGSKGTPVEYKSGQLAVIDDPLVQVMASGLNITPAQLLIRYQIECGHNVVVKTSSGFRLWDNLQSLDITLTPGQVDALHALNRNKRNYTFSGMGDTHKNYPFKIAF